MARSKLGSRSEGATAAERLAYAAASSCATRRASSGAHIVGLFRGRCHAEWKPSSAERAAKAECRDGGEEGQRRAAVEAGGPGAEVLVEHRRDAAANDGRNSLR